MVNSPGFKRARLSVAYISRCSPIQISGKNGHLRHNLLANTENTEIQQRGLRYETLCKDGSRHICAGIAADTRLDHGARTTLVRSASQCMVCATTLACRQQLCSDKCD